MILKIERHNQDKAWFLIDGIKSIDNYKQTKYHTPEERKHVFESVPEHVLMDNKRCNCFPPEEKCDECPSEKYYLNYKVARLGLRMKDGSTEHLVFDTVAYILNDQGKTIEKIVVNYPMYKEDNTKR